jgi:hypothetical protein
MNTYHDGNHTATLLAVEADGVTLVNIQADPTTHGLDISNGTSGTDNGPTTSFHDGNHTAILMATSSTDGKTPVAVYGNSSMQLLVDET